MSIPNICEIVRKQESDYISGNTTISKYVSFSMYENIEKIDAYLNSKHISGETDALGREKPFFNIVTAATNIWYRATDIDRKNIRIKASKRKHVILSYLATVKLQDFMRREAFGVFLNEWGRSLARYGSSILKFVEQDGRLYPMVMPWNRMIVDAVDFENNVKIEKLWLTPAQLKKKKGYDQEVVESLLDAIQTRKLMDKQSQDTKTGYIPLYEVHGELPLSLITGKESDDDTYVQQMHVISFVAGSKKGTYEDFTLIKGREEKDPYMITHLIKEDGRTQSIGAVEHLFEAQWMMNHTAKSIKDQLDLASKLIFQTADSAFVGQNALSAIEQGDIMVHEVNKPLTQVQNNSHDITALQSFGQQWQVLAKEITSTPDAISGNTMPSGTAYRQVAILNQESHSLFEIMIENKGLALEEMLRRYIIPFLKKQLNTKEEIAAVLSAGDIAKIDAMYVPNEAIKRSNNRIKKEILEGRMADPADLPSEENMIRNDLASQGNQRFFLPSDVSSKTWKELFDGFEWDVEVEITNETTDKEAVMTTLTTILQSIAANPTLLTDPTAKVLFTKIIEATGAISPIELPTQSPQPLPTNPAGGAVDPGNVRELAVTQ